MEKESRNEIILFNDENLTLEVKVDPNSETIWLSQTQMASLFETTSDNIGLHIKNIIDENELDTISTTEEFSVVRTEGNRSVKRKNPAL